MHPTHDLKYLNVTSPTAIIDNATVTTAEVDRDGAGYVDFLVKFGAMDIAVTAFKLQESDVSGSGYVDVEGATFAGNYPSATADNTMWAFHVNASGRKRYLKLVITVGDGAAGTFVDATAILSELRRAPITAAERGLAGEVFVS
jgi:hypothetical protein